jgi:hypothetical protein
MVNPFQLEQGSARPLIKAFDVKKRQYFGNTSMEAEISLLMANQTLVSTTSSLLCHIFDDALRYTGFVRKVNL